MTVIRQYKLETTTKFSCFKSDKMFGAGDPFAKQRKVYLKDDNIPFDGVPFSIIGTKVFDCQHGPDRKKSFKARHSEEKVCWRRFLPQDTMKFGCHASIRLSEVIKYCNYKDDTERLRRDMSKKLKTDITSGQKPQVERRIYIQLPKEDEHKDRIPGEIGGILQPIDKRLVDKIGELVGEGVKTVDETKRHLRQFVKTELFPGQSPPASTNRRYYPTDVDIRNHMYQASVKKIMSKSDQENFEKKIENWCQENPQDSFYFRPCALSASSTASESMNNEETDQNCVRDDLLFAHQTAWKKQLMICYGNEITMLDATYKTMRYELPLLFLVVKTNVNYIVVGSFIIQRETTASIQEALGIFHDCLIPLLFTIENKGLF
ncbi:unnamed protein product [Porites lobata]|uniref:MULE transposase domain-containing protein n=1 Tax=Porites lobata TaxID=104759 RepID=A0ABN8RRY8_9CNID|nr:unnamed protein product [Porites lobata]